MLSVVLVIAASSAAHAHHAVTLVGAPQACPSHEAFGDALRAIFPDVEILTTGDGLRVELMDSGARYRVVAGTVAREFVDPARRCEERARNAAVFVALVLEPPNVERVEHVEQVEPPIEAAAFPRVAFDVGGLFDSAPRSENTLAVGGGRVELAVGSAALAGVIGVDLVSATTMDLGTVRARLTRVPFSIGGRATWHRGSSAMSFDAAAVAAIQITMGLDTTSSSEQTRLELGLRAAATYTVQAWQHVAPFISIDAELVPSPYDLVWSGMGIVGTTPRAWLGAVIGCEFALH